MPENEVEVVKTMDTLDDIAEMQNPKPTEQAAPTEVSETTAESETEEKPQDDKPNDPDEHEPKGVQKRINKLVKEKSEYQREAEYWKQIAQGAQEPKQQSEPVSTSEDKPNPDEFETQADYVEAITEWKVEQKLKQQEAQRQQTTAKTEFESKVQAFRERANEFAKTTPDYNDVIAGVDDIPMSPSVQTALLDAENGAQVIYELAKDPERFEKINQMSLIQAAKEIGKVEAEIAFKSTKPKQENKTTQAPNPINPVGGASAAVVKKESEMSDSEWYEWQRQQKSKGIK